MEARPQRPIGAQPTSDPHPDGYMSQSVAYNGSYPDTYPSRNLQKDRSSPLMTAQS